MSSHCQHTLSKSLDYFILINYLNQHQIVILPTPKVGSSMKSTMPIQKRCNIKATKTPTLPRRGCDYNRARHGETKF